MENIPLNPTEVGIAVFVALVAAQGAFRLADKALDLVKKNGVTRHHDGPLNGALKGSLESQLVNLLVIANQLLQEIKEPLGRMASDIHDVKERVKAHSLSIEEIRRNTEWLRTREEFRGGGGTN